MADIKKIASDNISNISLLLNGINIDSIKNEGLTMRLGNQILKFSLSSESESIENEIRNELKLKLGQKIEIIREKVNEKITEMSQFTQTIISEYERKEYELKRQLSNSSLMPNINISDAEKGLSVVKGSGTNRLVWLVQGIYWPKTLDKEPLKATFSKKMLSHVVFLIETKDNIVTNVTTRQPIGLSYFQHYHQANPDCWGNWKYPKTWNTPQDIIWIAKEAEAVLENINTASIAKANPAGLPRKNTVLRNVLKKSEISTDKMGILNQELKRTGITENIRRDDVDVWMAEN